MCLQGITRLCLTLVFDRFLSHAPVPYIFLESVLYYISEECAWPVTKHVNKVLVDVNLRLTFVKWT